MSAPELDIVGIGSMVVDRVHRAPRILRGDEKGILRAVEGAGPVRRFVGGVVLNHLGWATALGARVGVTGRQGDDADGRFLRAAMDRTGIAREIVLCAQASSVAEIFVDDSGERAIYMAPGATSETSRAHVAADHADFIRRARRLSTEVSQLPLAAACEALRVAREAGLHTVVDLDVPPSDAVPGLGNAQELEEVLRAADLLKPSKRAIRELLPEIRNDSLELARAARARFGGEAVVVTDGAAGCAIAADSFEGFVPARPVQAVDTTGAGDAFLGGLLAALSHGFGWPDAAKLANACGAACALQLGAFPEELVDCRARALELYEGDAKVPEVSLAPGLRAEPAAAPALHVLDVAAEELALLRQRHDGSAFAAAADLVERALAAAGRVHVTGVGKPEHVARYAASLLASTGTPASFLHATETLHGSLGQVVAGDVVIAVSNSGETAELCDAVDALSRFGARVIAVTGDLGSRLARSADAVLDAAVAREGGPLGLAPRSSVAAELLVLAALGAELQVRHGFTRDDYADRHPAGKLGARARS